MAELKPLGREIGQPKAPDISGAGEVYSALGKTAEAFSSTIGTHVATQRKAALEMEATYNTLNAQREIHLNTLRFKERENVTEADLAELNKTNAQIAQSILEVTSGPNINQVKKNLLEFSIKSEATAFEHVGASKKKSVLDSAATLLYEGSKQLEELAITGQQDLFEQTFQQIDRSQRSLVEAGYLSELDYRKARDDLIQAGIEGHIRHEYNNALLAGGERAGAKYIQDFADSAQPGITEAQKDRTIKSLIAQQSLDKSASIQIEQAGYRDVMMAITGPNPPKDENELISLIESTSFEYPMNEYQQYQILQEFRKRQKTTNKRNETNVVISKQIAANDINGLLDQSATDINNNYIDTRKALIERANEQSQGSLSPADRIQNQAPEWLIGAAIAAQTPVPIKQWQSEIHSQLTSQNTDDILNAVNAYDYVYKSNKRGVDGIAEQDKAFIRAISNDLNRTTLTPQEVVEKYRKSILDVDPKVLENRQAAYKEVIKNSPNLPQAIIQEAFGTKIKNQLATPSAELAATAQQAFEREYKLTGDRNQAIQNAVEYLKDNGGISKFAPKDSPVWNPPENLPFYDFGNIVPNQATKFLKETVNNIADHPGRLPYTVEWSSKMGEFPDRPSEQDLFKNKYDKGEWWLKIDGVDRRVYFISPNYNQANSFPETRYQVFYDKNGYLNQLMTVAPGLDEAGNVVASAGNAFMIFRGPNELTPNLVNKMLAEDAEGARDKYVERQYEGETPLQRTISKLGKAAELTETANPSRVLGEKTEEKKVESKIELETLKKITAEKNKELPKKIEQERFKRQRAAAKKLIDDQGEGK